MVDRLRILVADDEAPVRRLLESHLTALGHEVVLAKDGREAIAILEEQTFDRVIVDLMMPYVDGLQVIHWIRTKSSKPETWVGLMTAQAEAMKGSRREFSNIDKFIQKPIILKDLLEDDVEDW